jgi:hypothetical protein
MVWTQSETTADYFLGDRSVPWWAVAFSIVATETLDHHLHFRTGNRLRLAAATSVSATSIWLPARPHCHLLLFIPSYFAVSC